jgi:glucose-1-phosphate thymidylyltransferase
MKNEKIKGIILAGGKATRLYPATAVISKQLLPVYDKPMIYYPLSTLMLAGIREILIISTPTDLPKFREFFGDGSQLGIKISYAVQEKPRGLSDAFIVGKEFIGDDRVCLVLGDNIFFGHGFPEILRKTAEKKEGATIFCYQVTDPERYGVAEIDAKNNVLSIEEKPKKPKSNYAIVGLYFCDNQVVEIAENLKPSERGELEITDMQKTFLNMGQLKAEKLGRGFAWLDTGTFESMAEAAEFVRVIQNRQGHKIACIEEIAYKMNFINAEQLKKIAEPLMNSGYGKYLLNILDEKQEVL